MFEDGVGPVGRVRPRRPGVHRDVEQGLKPVCGRCKASLPAAPLDSHPLNITDTNFSAEVERSPVPVLLDMWAPWCGPCRTMTPLIEQLASEMAGRVRVGKMNVDENPITSDRFNIRSIPTLLVFKGGQVADQIVGKVPKDTIDKVLQRHISS